MKRRFYGLIIAASSSAVVGYAFIFWSIKWLGDTELWTWQMWVQILMVAFGGVILIRNGEKNYK